MSKTVPLTFSASSVQPQEYQAFDDVEVSDWTSLLQAQNFLWSRSGARCNGRVFNPPFQRNNTVYGQTGDGSQPYDLQVWYGSLHVQRRIDSNQYELAFTGYGRNIDVRVNVIRFNSDGTTTALTGFVASTSNSVDYEWFTNSFAYSEALLYSSGNVNSDLATIGVFIEARNQGSGTAVLFQFAVHETIGVAADLPAA